MNIILKDFYSKYKLLCYMTDIVSKPPARSRQNTTPGRKEICHFATEFGQDLGLARPSIQW